LDRGSAPSLRRRVAFTIIDRLERTGRRTSHINAQLSIGRVEARISPDPVSEPDYLVTTLDGSRVVESMRYGNGDVAQYGIQAVRQWAAEDLQRYQAWERDEWRFVDVRLVAIVEVSADERQVGRVEIDGPVLSGVESDAGEEYMNEIVGDLAGEFSAELTEVGFDTSHIRPSPMVFET
jgi:hypothetical protein